MMIVTFAKNMKHFFSSSTAKLASLLKSFLHLLCVPIMMLFVTFSRGMKHFFNCSRTNLACLYNSFFHMLHVLILRVNPLWIELSYFIIFSIAGYLCLKVSNPKTALFTPKDMDIFFTAVSAVTVSSTSTVEMEVFSNAQLIILMILIFVGGEVFTSFLGLQLLKLKKTPLQERESKIESCMADSDSSNSIPDEIIDQIELGVDSLDQKTSNDQNSRPNSENGKKSLDGHEELMKSSIQILGYVVLFYLLTFHLFGYTLVSIYTSIVPNAREVLKKKGLNLFTFSAFTTISTFANCGFLPTNENMMIFKKHSGLLLILIPQVLMGNTLFPPCLRFLIWALQKITKRAEFTYMLRNPKALGYVHLLSGLHSAFLVITVFGFVMLQFLLFCILEWKSNSTADLSVEQKLVGSLFQVVNSRHAGECVFDLSLISPAMLVLFVLMMYLPPYTSVVPIGEDENIVLKIEEKIKSTKKTILECLLFSQLTYVVISIILICISERDKMKEDSLNFNLLSIVVEVIGAYGNVGFSMGYSCERQIKPGDYCQDASYGLAGRWSNLGKFILIIVMFFGRFKTSYSKGGKAWRLS